MYGLAEWYLDFWNSSHNHTTISPKVVQFWCQRTQNLATKVLKKCQPGNWKIVIQGTENVPTKELKYRQLTNSLSRVLKKHQPGGKISKCIPGAPLMVQYQVFHSSNYGTSWHEITLFSLERNSLIRLFYCCWREFFVFIFYKAFCFLKRKALPDIVIWKPFSPRQNRL